MATAFGAVDYCARCLAKHRTTLCTGSDNSTTLGSIPRNQEGAKATRHRRRGPLRWHISYNLAVLRMISYGMDLHWARVATAGSKPLPAAGSSDVTEGMAGDQASHPAVDQVDSSLKVCTNNMLHVNVDWTCEH